MLKCKDIRGQYVQERSAEGVTMVSMCFRGYDYRHYVQHMIAEVMTMDSMCRRGFQRVWQWAICIEGETLGSMCRRGV